MMKIEKISDDWIKILNSMFKEFSILVVCEQVNKLGDKFTILFFEEIKKRNLKEISVYDSINKKSYFEIIKDKTPQLLDQEFSFSEMTDNEVKIYYALSAEIEDYSCLGAEIRKYIDAIYFNSLKELDNRNLDKQFLCDWHICDNIEECKRTVWI